MPPDSTQNLNSKLSHRSHGARRRVGGGITWTASAIHQSAPPVRIVRGPSSYRGGYHLSF